MVLYGPSIILETEPSISAKHYQHNCIDASRSYGITELHFPSNISAETLFPVLQTEIPLCSPLPLPRDPQIPSEFSRASVQALLSSPAAGEVDDGGFLRGIASSPCCSFQVVRRFTTQPLIGDLGSMFADWANDSPMLGSSLNRGV